jgi:hypothetical protein
MPAMKSALPVALSNTTSLGLWVLHIKPRLWVLIRCMFRYRIRIQILLPPTHWNQTGTPLLWNLPPALVFFIRCLSRPFSRYRGSRDVHNDRVRIEGLLCGGLELERRGRHSSRKWRGARSACPCRACSRWVESAKRGFIYISRVGMISCSEWQPSGGMLSFCWQMRDWSMDTGTHRVPTAVW